LSKSFGETEAISSLDFQVYEGEIFGIVGPDGAGKSTLLRLMSTILRPDAGSILINGKDIYKDVFSIKENLAYMPQRFGLYEDLTVEENIYFFGRLFGVSGTEIKKRVKRLYDFSQLGPFSRRLAGNLSGGMKQKLGLACCLIHTPGLILLDEPTNGVDPVSRREFWRILYDLLGEGVTIVVSTAYLDEAERCNRVGLMYSGKFIKLGYPKKIREEMKSRMVEVIVSDPRKGETVMGKYEFIDGIIRTGNSLRLFVRDLSVTTKKISQALGEENIAVSSIREMLPTLEDCFMESLSMGVLP